MRGEPAVAVLGSDLDRDVDAHRVHRLLDDLLQLLAVTDAPDQDTEREAATNDHLLDIEDAHVAGGQCPEQDRRDAGFVVSGHGDEHRRTLRPRGVGAAGVDIGGHLSSNRNLIRPTIRDFRPSTALP